MQRVLKSVFLMLYKYSHSEEIVSVSVSNQASLYKINTLCSKGNKYTAGL